MRSNARSACLLALLAAASLLAPAAARSLGLDICETYDHATCLEHADKCTPCKAWGKYDTCFETAIAQKLPPKLFQCAFAPPPPPPEPQPGESPEPDQPDTDCGGLLTESDCEAHSCVWCISAAVPSACYSEAEAKRLPAAVFRCKFPSLLEQ